MSRIYIFLILAPPSSTINQFQSKHIPLPLSSSDPNCLNLTHTHPQPHYAVRLSQFKRKKIQSYLNRISLASAIEQVCFPQESEPVALRRRRVTPLEENCCAMQ